jgi:hypothetical protein
MAIWSILRPFGLFYGHLVYFVAISYNSCSFGIFFLLWYVAPSKIWQPCTKQRQHLIENLKVVSEQTLMQLIAEMIIIDKQIDGLSSAEI